jgi:hypothetical protein
VASDLPAIGSLWKGTGATECGAGADDAATEPAVDAATTLSAAAATTVAIASNRTGRNAMDSSSRQVTHQQGRCVHGSEPPVAHRDGSRRRCTVNILGTISG